METFESRPHVYPGAVTEQDHDGTPVLVDKGMISGPCGQCGFVHLHQLLSPDEQSGAGWIGYDIIACCSCLAADEGGSWAGGPA